MKCPYNQAHIMPKESFLNHLRKCQATNKKDFIQCKFDLFHVVRKQVIQKHYLECKAKKYHDQKNEEEADDWNEIVDRDDKDIQSNNWSSQGPGIYYNQQEIKQRKGRNGKNAAPSNKNNNQEQGLEFGDWGNTSQKEPKKEKKQNKNEEYFTQEWGDGSEKVPFQVDVSRIQREGRRQEKKGRQGGKQKQKKEEVAQKSKKKKKEEEELVIGEW